MVGIEHQTYRARREVVQPVPDARHDQQPLIRSVERVGELVATIIDSDIKAAADGHNELLARVVAVATPLYPTRHIIDIECALHVKGQFNTVFHNSEVAVGMMVPVEADDAAIVDARHAMSILVIHFNVPPQVLAS